MKKCCRCHRMNDDNAVECKQCEWEAFFPIESYSIIEPELPEPKLTDHTPDGLSNDESEDSDMAKKKAKVAKKVEPKKVPAKPAKKK